MITCISACQRQLGETINTLRFSQRAKCIKNKPVVNHDPKSKLIISLRQTVEKLQYELALTTTKKTDVEHDCYDCKSVIASSEHHKQFLDHEEEIIQLNLKCESLNEALQKHTDRCKEDAKEDV